MGGFTEAPLPLGDPGLTPAPDVPPNNNFDPNQFWSALVGSAQQAGVPGATQSGTSDAHLEAYAKELAALKSVLPDWLISLLKSGQVKLIELMQLVVAIIEYLVSQGQPIVAGMAQTYVSMFAEDQRGHDPQRGGTGSGPMGSVAQAAFDGIMAPIGILGGTGNPNNSGVGQANAEFILGSLVNLHLNTWMVDILHKMTGFGMFEWLHSFDEAVIGAMNTRGMARLAMKPFFNATITQPLTRDLNVKFMLAHGSAAGYVKDYLRGALDASGLQQRLAEIGYGPEVVAQYLLDAQKYMSLETVVGLVNTGQWTQDAAITYLEHQGYVTADAGQEFFHAQDALTKSINLDAARTVVDQVRHRVIDAPTGESLLKGLGFTTEEIYAFMQWAQLLVAPPAVKPGATPKPPKPGPHMEYGQVVRAYEAGILSLGDVESYLDDRGFSDDDITTMILLDFTKADQHSLVRAQRGARARVDAATATDAAATATAKADAAKAAAEKELAAAYAQLASFYGG
jgi:hypothetical protein